MFNWFKHLETAAIYKLLFFEFQKFVLERKDRGLRRWGEGALTVKVMQVSNLLLNSASSGTSGAPESDGLAVGNQRPTADQKNPIVAGGFRRWPAT